MAMYSRFSQYRLAHGNPKKLQKLLRNPYLSTISQMENKKQSIYLFFMYVMCKKNEITYL
jgi:protein tyrosine/serine phosphatase